MKKLHSCLSCGYMSTAGSEFTRIESANGRKVRVCDDCADLYGRDSEVTQWVNQAGDRLAAEAAKQEGEVIAAQVEH